MAHFQTFTLKESNYQLQLRAKREVIPMSTQRTINRQNFHTTNTGRFRKLWKWALGGQVAQRREWRREAGGPAEYGVEELGFVNWECELRRWSGGMRIGRVE